MYCTQPSKGPKPTLPCAYVPLLKGPKPTLPCAYVPVCVRKHNQEINFEEFHVLSHERMNQFSWEVMHMLRLSSMNGKTLPVVPLTWGGSRTSIHRDQVDPILETTTNISINPVYNKRHHKNKINNKFTKVDKNYPQNKILRFDDACYPPFCTLQWY